MLVTARAEKVVPHEWRRADPFRFKGNGASDRT